MIIETPRYTLSELRLSHEAQLAKIVHHPDFFYPYIQGNKKTLHKSLDENIHDYAQLGEDCVDDPNTFVMGIFTKNREDLLGVAVLVEVGLYHDLFIGADPVHDKEIGCFVDPEFQKQGIAREALHSLVDWAQDNKGVTGLWASFDPDFDASQAIAKGFDMAEIRRVPACDVPYTDRNGGERPRVIYKSIGVL